MRLQKREARKKAASSMDKEPESVSSGEGDGLLADPGAEVQLDCLAGVQQQQQQQQQQRQRGGEQQPGKQQQQQQPVQPRPAHAASRIGAEAGSSSALPAREQFDRSREVPACMDASKGNRGAAAGEAPATTPRVDMATADGGKVGDVRTSTTLPGQAAAARAEEEEQDSSTVGPSTGGARSRIPRPNGKLRRPKHMECVVCLDARAEVMLLPCKHTILCQACTGLVRGRGRSCPMCRTEVEGEVLVGVGGGDGAAAVIAASTTGELSRCAATSTITSTDTLPQAITGAGALPQLAGRSSSSSNSSTSNPSSSSRDSVPTTLQHLLPGHLGVCNSGSHTPLVQQVLGSPPSTATPTGSNTTWTPPILQHLSVRSDAKTLNNSSSSSSSALENFVLMSAGEQQDLKGGRAARATLIPLKQHLVLLQALAVSPHGPVWALQEVVGLRARTSSSSSRVVASKLSCMRFLAYCQRQKHMLICL